MTVALKVPSGRCAVVIVGFIERGSFRVGFRGCKRTVQRVWTVCPYPKCCEVWGTLVLPRGGVPRIAGGRRGVRPVGAHLRREPGQEGRDGAPRGGHQRGEDGRPDDDADLLRVRDAGGEDQVEREDQADGRLHEVDRELADPERDGGEVHAPPSTARGCGRLPGPPPPWRCGPSRSRRPS